jgi:dephospho-CoA kinase
MPVDDPGKLVVLVCGRIGTGTGALLEMFSSLGHATVDADDVAHRLTQKGTPAYQQILDRVGPACLAQSGELDRFKLNQAARTDPQLARDLRGITASAVNAELRELILRSRGRLVFVRTHSPTAYAARDLADQVWLVTANDDAQVANLVGEKGGPGLLQSGLYAPSRLLVVTRSLPT